MPIVSLLDLEQSLKLNQMLMDNNLNGSAATNNLNLLLKNTSNTTTNNANSAILASALIQQIQQQQNLNNKFFNNNILLNCIKSNLAANLNSSLNSSLTDNPKQMNYGRYKTELCRQFSENGECKYGDKCQFAHGVADLKDVNRHPKYKTDYCKTFHSKGFCPYGPRCHFIHEFYEKNTEIIDNNKLNTKQQEKKQKSSSLLSSSSTKQQQEDINLNSQIDKQLEAIQAQLTSSLFSTITEESSSAIINETTLSAEQLEANSNKLADKLNDPLDEFNQYSSGLTLIMPTNESNEKENFLKLLSKVKLHSSETSSLCSPDSFSRTRTSSSSAGSSSNDFFDLTKSTSIDQHGSYINMNSESCLKGTAEQNTSEQIDNLNFKLKFDQF
jgi:hypothetical protein